jgi:small subunit ribosomal protein S9
MAEDNRSGEPEETTPEPSEEQAAETERQLDPEQRIVDEPVAESEELAAEDTQIETPGDEVVVEGEVGIDEDVEDEEEEEEPTPRVKPLIPGADLEVDIVREGEEALRQSDDPYAQYDEETGELIEPDAEEDLSQPIADASIDLGAGARYTATGKRKTAVARVILKPGDGTYTINGRSLEVFFPRNTLQRTIRQPLETVGYETRMDVIASMHGGGVSAQAGALRHGISRALIEADPNLRSELKRRGFLTRDARVKERKKAGLKKARKRPQFSKR